jgi:predicted O-methyltransferase YrrM
MSAELWTEVDRYIGDLFLDDDPVLAEVLKRCRDEGLPAINISAAQGKLLWILARQHQARRILEIGTLGGYSTIWLARALPPNGALVTLEIDPRHIKVAQSNLAALGPLAQAVTLRQGDAHETLASMADEGTPPFDLVFIDAEKTGYPDYLDWALKLTRPGSLIVADNVVRRGAVIDAASEDENIHGVRRYLELLAERGDVETTVIQTVGAKGYDGLAFSLVTDAP